MGRLVGLELHNFKSYKGTTSIGFGTSCFTSIIGPNGAGKSNMMDAISFVLGVKSSQLRSQNMRDLIYRGRLEDSELFDASLDVIDQTRDPVTAYVTAFYEKDDGEKLEFKRIITANGSTDYKINNGSVTASNYSTVLKNENILIKAKNFLVFQGDVELIASQTPKDLTSMIETISGSIELSKEYAELHEELEKAHEFSNSVFARKRNLSSESKQYKDQLAEQEIFELKLTDKSDLTKIINLYKLYHNEVKHNTMNDTLQTKLKQFKELKKELAKEEKEYQKTILDFSNESLEVSKFTEKIDNLNVKIELKRAEIVPITTNQKTLMSKINSNKTKIKDLTSEIAKKKVDITSIDAQLKDVKKSFKLFEDRIAASLSASNLSSQDHQEYEHLKKDYLSHGGSELEEQLSVSLNEKESINTMIKNNQEQILTLKNAISELEFTKNSELLLSLNTIDSEISQLLSTKDDKVNTRNKIKQKLENFNYEELKLNTQLRDVLTKLDELSSKQRESNKYKRQREILATLRNLLPQNQIRGFVHELIRPTHKKYDVALITLLGRNFDAIIVETSATAYKCIEILKERRLGVATFIPLDSISNEHINLNLLRSINSKAQPGVDIVDLTDKSLENAVNYIIGNAIVTEDTNTARELKWGQRKLENKIVTLQGSVINRSGLMTGGANTERYENITWDKTDIKTLTELKNDLIQEIERLNKEKPKEIEINLISDEISLLDDKLPLLRNQKDSLERSIRDRDTEILFDKNNITSIENVIEEYQEKLKVTESQIYQLNSQIDLIQDNIFAEFCKAHKFKNGIRDYEEIHGSALRVKTKERAQYSKMVASLSNKLKYENDSLNETEARKEKLELDTLSLEEKFLQVSERKEEVENEQDKLQAEFEVLQAEKVKKDEDLKRKMKFATHIEGNIKDKKAEIESSVKDITVAEELLSRVDIERVNILKNCKIENINIPLIDGVLEQISLNESVDKVAKEIYEIEVDYEMLSDDLRDNYSIRKESELIARMNDVIEQLERLTPNAKASERLKATETRLKEFDRDFSKARQRENKALLKFNDVKAKRFELFNKAFEHISGVIDDVYKDLTKSAASPLGGSAYLTLENEDEPYLHGIKYHAMPPMKRFRDMDLLSGGEKTMAALALLFAIHSFQPSPFFVLDEVDAALDSANVNRIANYIKKISSPTFQFIVISLKSALFEKSDSLVGIFREQNENSSKTLTLDLREFAEDEIPIVGATA